MVRFLIVCFQAAVGKIAMKDGERYAYIDITILDNNIPEDEKSFVVTLMNPSGGAVLGVASVVTVMIEHSDGAFGIFQIADLYRGLQADETGDSDYNIVTLKVRTQSNSVCTKYVYISVKRYGMPKKT